MSGEAPIYKERTTCRVCGGLLEGVLDMGILTITNFGEKELAKAPLHLTKCRTCNLIQLKHTVDPQYLFREYYYYSSTNESMRAQLQDIVQSSLQRIILAPGDTIVDIGSNDATLLGYVPDSFIRVGFEPALNIPRVGSGIYILISDFFSASEYEKALPDKKAKIVYAISMFYDLEDPNRFLEDVKRILADDGLFVVQMNYLVAMLSQNAFDNLVSEHLLYFSVTTLKTLLDRHGLYIDDVEFNDTNGGSFRTYIRKRMMEDTPSDPTGANVLEAMLSEARMNLDKPYVYKDYAAKVILISRKIRNFVDREVSKGKTFMIAGASTRGNTLLQVCKIDERSIPYAVERNPAKFGKKWNDKISVISEKTADELPPDYYLVLPWHFLSSFFAREQKFLRQGGKLLIPLPKPAVVSVEEL